MAIELSGVQFGLKSQVWFQTKNCTTRGSIATLLHLFWNPFVLFCCFILIDWEKDAIWSKNRAIWAGINRTTQSQSDCKDNQWFQNGFNKKTNIYKILKDYSLHLFCNNINAILLPKLRFQRIQRTEQFCIHNWLNGVLPCCLFKVYYVFYQPQVSPQVTWQFTVEIQPLFLWSGHLCLNAVTLGSLKATTWPWQTRTTLQWW